MAQNSPDAQETRRGIICGILGGVGAHVAVTDAFPVLIDVARGYRPELGNAQYVRLLITTVLLGISLGIFFSKEKPNLGYVISGLLLGLSATSAVENQLAAAIPLAVAAIGVFALTKYHKRV